jgi:WD40 repeat protein
VKTNGGVISLAFSPDGKRVAAGAVEPEGTDSTNYTVWIWTVQDGVPERVLKGADAPVDSLAFSPDGQVLAGNGSYQGVIGLLRAQDGVVLRLLEGHTSSVYQLAFSPDGQLLATGAADGTAVIWGIPQGNEPATPAPVQSNIAGTAEMDGLKITLNSVRHAQEGVTQSNGSADVPGDGREFFFANVTLENTTDKPKPLYLPGEFKILNTWKNVIGPVDSTSSYKIADALAEKAGNELAPHAKVTGEMAFRLSLNDKDLTLEYWPMLSPGSIVFKLDR